jgi:hypothetical protein
MYGVTVTASSGGRFHSRWIEVALGKEPVRNEGLRRGAARRGECRCKLWRVEELEVKNGVARKVSSMRFFYDYSIVRVEASADTARSSLLRKPVTFH